jgi:hypothetical protein
MKLSTNIYNYLVFKKRPDSARIQVILAEQDSVDDEQMSECYDSEQKAVERFLVVVADTDNYSCDEQDRDTVTTLSEAYREYQEDRDAYITKYAIPYGDIAMDDRAAIFDHVCYVYFRTVIDEPYNAR